MCTRSITLGKAILLSRGLPKGTGDLLLNKDCVLTRLGVAVRFLVSSEHQRGLEELLANRILKPALARVRGQMIIQVTLTAKGHVAFFRGCWRVAHSI